MSQPRLVLKKLVEHVLGKGTDLPLALLLEHLVPVSELRRLGKKFDLSPKGFRVDRAPARVLARQLAELKDSQQLDEVVGLLAPPPAEANAEDVDAKKAAAARAEAAELLRLREGELQRVRDELERARDAARRAGERESALMRQHERLELELVAERRDREALERSQADNPGAKPAAADAAAMRALQRRVHELEDEREAFVTADEASRRRLAHMQSRLRAAEAEVQELETLIPKSRRRKKKPLPPAEPEAPARVIVPRFQPSFYKSFVGKERRAVEQAVQAILLFCTQGHSYPGLEVKQLGGQDTWSLRASLGLRVYFRPLQDGDIEVLELADREDQRTTLRRLKDK